MPSAWTRRDLVVRQVGRADDLRAVAAEVLALEVVELPRRQHDLAGERGAGDGARHGPRGSPPRPRGPTMADSMSTLSSSANASSRAPASSEASCTFETPTLDPARAGLTNVGSPRAAASARTPSGSLSQRARVTVTHGDTGTPAACEHDLHEVLVHAQRGVEHPAAGVRDAERVEEALDRAVLAVQAVQDRQDDVHGAELVDRAVGATHAQRPVGAAFGPERRACRCRRPRAAASASSANLSGSSSSRTKTPSRVMPTGITR